MKRKLSSLKSNECIHIRTEKEARKISKMCKKEDIGDIWVIKRHVGDVIFTHRRNITWSSLESAKRHGDIIYTASDFIKPKSKLKKRVKALEDAVFSKTTMAKTELTELPEKWCVEITDESFYDLFRWLDPACIPTKNKTFGGFVSSGKYWINAEDYGSTEGVKISFAEFKRLVLKEQPKEIDWSKPGQYVSTDDGLILMTLDGDSSGDNTFSAVVIQDNRNNYCHYDAGHKSDIWLKSNFKLHTEPITINPV